MALWVFGDSFSVARASINKGDTELWPLWTEALADKLNLSGYYNYAQWGVGNEYILEQFLSHQMEYEPEDCIVIQLTSSARQWFFKDHPETANFYIKDRLDKIVSSSAATAVEQYIKHLHRPEIDELRYFMMVKTLEKLAQDLNYCRILILPGFHSVPGVTGTLMNICCGEFVSNESEANWYSNNYTDPRPNHFGQQNHKILSDRLFDFFQTGAVVDLSNGYQKGFL